MSSRDGAAFLSMLKWPGANGPSRWDPRGRWVQHLWGFFSPAQALPAPTHARVWHTHCDLSLPPPPLPSTSIRP
jgi:hypothetical protein